ncbi:phosphate transport system substrate-binding protein [Dialister histaminiformans]|uniref:Phosphate-binding protein n=1 Tax=Allisonella histaminiformans TaxID=209880 RepID=A0A1G5VV94_9FIRM|nr:phosphate ABC transporter substrate-binding protein [Allisonella histaminiformans]MCI6003054.1 phosphate ABC transporter substrate-binding protein [Allisonella histaminiformans]PWL45410.1 MAG: phosphate ABC transporter substrate-binding protein [Veillonellaceae bacterium]SDA49772.1 phosphate transport system substrate-binding protein [Allisonella histaminiformans]
MNKKKWAAALLISVFAAGLALTGCGGNDAGESGPSGKVTVSGSSALLPLAKDAAQKFKAKNDQVSITLNAGGSGTGLKQVSEGSVDIGNSDVFAKEKLPEAKAAELVDHKVAVTVMAPVVSKEIGTNVKSLTKAQLQDIFTGKVTNWKDVGGPDEAVVLITRPSTSGTRALFTKYALDGKEELSNKSMETDDSGTLVQTVSQTKGAIGYVALSYLMNNNTVTPLAIDGVEPTLENVYNGKYPVWGYEHMYTKGEATGAVKAFIDFIMSKDYSADIEKQGYGVASKMKVTRE